MRYSSARLNVLEQSNMIRRLDIHISIPWVHPRVRFHSPLRHEIPSEAQAMPARTLHAYIRALQSVDAAAYNHLKHIIPNSH